MKVLLIGGAGRIGRRYASILEYLGVTYGIHDLEEETSRGLSSEQFDQAIIASPTDTHTEYCRRLLAMKKPFLCEKPISKNLAECIEIRDRSKKEGAFSFLVNNYLHAVVQHTAMNPAYQGKLALEWDYYNPGPEYAEHGDAGLFWDVCQVLRLDRQAEIRTGSPVWNFWVNGERMPYRTMEMSYVTMVEAFIDGRYGKLWTMQDGVDMTAAVMQRVGHESSLRNSGKE